MLDQGNRCAVALIPRLHVPACADGVARAGCRWASRPAACSGAPGACRLGGEPGLPLANSSQVRQRPCDTDPTLQVALLWGLGSRGHFGSLRRQRRYECTLGNPRRSLRASAPMRTDYDIGPTGSTPSPCVRARACVCVRALYARACAYIERHRPYGLDCESPGRRSLQGSEAFGHRPQQEVRFGGGPGVELSWSEAAVSSAPRRCYCCMCAAAVAVATLPGPV
jgi:hypothetical protein